MRRLLSAFRPSAASRTGLARPLSSLCSSSYAPQLHTQGQYGGHESYDSNFEFQYWWPWLSLCPAGVVHVRAVGADSVSEQEPDPDPGRDVDQKSNEDETLSRVRGQYNRFQPDEKLAIAREASRQGISVTIAANPSMRLKWTSVQLWMKKYRGAKAAKQGTEPTALECGLVPRPKRQPSLGTYDATVNDALQAIRRAGGAVNHHIFSNTVRGMLAAEAPHMLQENGGWIDPSSVSLRQSFWRRHSFVLRRRTSTRTLLTAVEVQTRKGQFLNDTNGMIFEHDIIDPLVINFDETPLEVMPSSSYTMAVRGTRNVRITGAGDKRQITALVGVARDGCKLGWQLIYTGTTNRCHPPAGLLPDCFQVTHSKSHWSNSSTKLQYLNGIILPYVQRVRNSIGLVPPNDHALVIFDMHRTNTNNPEFYDALRANRILWSLIPASMTDELQPCDQDINRFIKAGMRREFNGHYSQLVTAWLQRGNPIDTFKFDYRWTTIKRRHCSWIGNVYESLTAQAVLGSWRQCEIASNADQVQSDEETAEEQKEPDASQ